jgi:hypothetical protein
MRGQPMGNFGNGRTKMGKPITDPDWQVQDGVWSEEVFLFLLTLEQRRSKRSNNPFVLTIVNAMKSRSTAPNILQLAMPAITSAIRETDLIGWIEKPSVLGIIFTHVDATLRKPNTAILEAKLEMALQEKLGREIAARVAISTHIFTDPIEALQSASTSGFPGQSWMIH